MEVKAKKKKKQVGGKNEKKKKIKPRHCPYFTHFFTAACGQPGECSGKELPVQDLLQTAPLAARQSRVVQLSTQKRALKQEALANIDVSQHAAGTRPRKKGSKKFNRSSRETEEQGGGEESEEEEPLSSL